IRFGGYTLQVLIVVVRRLRRAHIAPGRLFLMRTLLTGYGPFGAVAANPSQSLVEWFDLTGAPGHALTCLSLPVSYTRAMAVLEAALTTGVDGHPYDAVLSLGVAAGETAWRVERLAFNRTGRPDIDGYAPSTGLLEEAGPPELEATLPCEMLAQAIVAQGLPARISDSAGDYLCNAALYRSLRYAAQAGDSTRCGFIHIPSDVAGKTREDEPAFEFADHVRAVEAALEAIRSAMAAVGATA
ncbi:MAG: hypothetical protein KGK12_15485, partial [Armatimonadetes bacterium]|nr:hypothetical protein [Armatimonadota bacterium]